uniref:Uncharacterized protein n=1 Tax=Aegilops tauschii subsp. strangulata TaxID=200361 RepID=A0A453I4L0_AEGTS
MCVLIYWNLIGNSFFVSLDIISTPTFTQRGECSCNKCLLIL